MKNFPSLIGVIHLPALAGAPGSQRQHPAEALHRAGLQAVQEAKLLEQAGFDGIILENFGDIPFYKDQVPPETVASLAVIAAAVRESARVALGVNVLRNDSRSALAIAAVSGCEFFRVNVLSGVAATDQGLIEGNAAFLARERLRLGADTKIFADIHVKHARSLSSDIIELALEEAALRASAEAVIVTGLTTGRGVDPQLLARASRAAKMHRVPLYVGSGANAETIGEIRPYVHGVIVSSALRKGGQAGAPLDAARCREFAKKFKASGKIKLRKR
jgi:membrane complex biogenesis BtpA family protein